MKILWLTWKDRQHPLAGGAELVNEELAKRLAADGHEVVFVVGGFKGAASRETITVSATPVEVAETPVPEDKLHVELTRTFLDILPQFKPPKIPKVPSPQEEAPSAAYMIIRLGNRWNVYLQTRRYYKQHLQGWADIVIDEVNTVPFFAKWYVRERNIIFAHMLCRQIWFYEMFLPLNIIGYLLEPIYLWLLRDREVITVSESTKRDLTKFGFKAEKIHIISEGIEESPLPELPSASDKFPKPTLLSLGSIRSMKRTLDQIKAFEIAKQTIPDLELIVAGDSQGRYGHKVLEAIGSSPYSQSIQYKGRVTGAAKLDLMRRAHLILVTSVKEGWGLIVTEASSHGTPAVVYNVDGLRDSVRDGETGLVTRTNTPQTMADTIVELLHDQTGYGSLRQKGWQWSKSINFDQSYQDFLGALK